jgi:capsular polysaccharide biosynthesis protein
MANESRSEGGGPRDPTAMNLIVADDPLEEGSSSSLDLGRLVQIVLRRLWIVVLTAVWLTGAVIGISLVQTPEYEASTKIIIGQGGGLTQSAIEVAGLRDITDTMVVAVDTRPVAKGVIRDLNLQESPDVVLDNMSVQRIGATQFIEVFYTDSDPSRAQLIANTIGTVFSEQISGVSPGPKFITASVWERAEIPDSPVNPDPIRNGLLASIVGLMLGVGLALLLEYLSVRGGRRQK